MFSGLAMPVGLLPFDPLGDVVKIEWLLIVTDAQCVRNLIALFLR
jgi:hypothetical protein